MESSTHQPAVGGSFTPTRWTLVLRARGQSPDARRALGDLCEAYWQPVFHFLRREGREEDVARELTQEFFARLLARHGLDTVEPDRGRFRSYLLGAVKHFLVEERARVHAAKRGGGREPVALECGADTTTELQIPDPTATVPDAYFDREWAQTVVNRGVETLALEFVSANKGLQFETLKPWLLGDLESLSQTDAAKALGMSEGAVKVAIHRLRKRFREIVKTEISNTVDDPTQVQAELHYLVEVLAKG